MFVYLTFVFFVLCIYTYFKHKIAKLCNIVCAMMHSVSLFKAMPFYMRTLYYREKQFCASVPCLHHWCIYGQCQSNVYIQASFTPACILFYFSVLIYSVIAYLAYIYAVFGLFLYVYTVNIQFYAVLCGKIEQISKCAGFAQTIA